MDTHIRHATALLLVFSTFAEPSCFFHQFWTKQPEEQPNIKDIIIILSEHFHFSFQDKSSGCLILRKTLVFTMAESPMYESYDEGFPVARSRFYVGSAMSKSHRRQRAHTLPNRARRAVTKRLKSSEGRETPLKRQHAGVDDNHKAALVEREKKVGTALSKCYAMCHG